MESTLIGEWHDFFVAQAGASAALTGLIFVAVSINLDRILGFSHLPTRALEAIITLLCVLLISTWGLVPNQSCRILGLETLATGLVTWIVQTKALLSTRRSGYETRLRVLLNQLPALPFVIAGVLLALNQPSGLYWIVPGVVLSVVAGVYCAWILLVEIQR
jgi:hypothetical protein